MNTRSIYSGKDYSRIKGAKDRAAAYAMELNTCERLRVMGFNSCDGVSLAARIDDLDLEIKRLLAH